MLTVSCAKYDDLRELQGWQRRNIGFDIKSALKDAPNCDFKPCGYKMDAGKDVTAIDDNTFQFPVQGNTVRRCA